MRPFTRLLLAIAVMAVLSRSANAQLVADSATPSLPAVLVSQAAFSPQVTYARPTQKMKLRGYLFDAFGPYPIVGAALAAGINQGENTPPEWKQGAEAYGKRFGSDFGIAGITTTTRYALAAAFREDTLYYRCQCKGVLPRLSHAIISTFSAATMVIVSSPLLQWLLLMLVR